MSKVPLRAIAEKYQQAWDTKLAYRRRIAELREYGAEDDGLGINQDSETDFWAFIQPLLTARQAWLFLSDDGNLRAVWDDDNDDDIHLALEFLGWQQVHYVIFRQLPSAEKVSRLANTATFAGIKQLISDYELTQLLYG